MTTMVMLTDEDVHDDDGDGDDASYVRFRTVINSHSLDIHCDTMHALSVVDHMKEGDGGVEESKSRAAILFLLAPEDAV